MKKTFLLLQGILCLLLLPLLSHAQGPGFNGYIDNTLWLIRNRQTHELIEIGGSYTQIQQPGQHANQWPDFSNSKQWWYVTPAPGGGPNDYKIVNRFSGQLLEIGGASTNSGATANQWYNTSTPNNHQVWTFVQIGSYYAIKNKNSQAYIRPASTSDGAEIVQVYTSSPLPIEQWEMIYYSPAYGAHLIRNVNSQKVLTAHADDNKVTQWGYSGIASEQWGFAATSTTSPAGSPCYYIFERLAQQVLEIGGGDDLMRAGHWANVWGTRTGQANQKWWLRNAATQAGLAINQTNGVQVELVNLNSGQVLEIGGYANELGNDNQRANQWPRNNPPTNNQRWTIEYISLNRSADTGATAAQAQTSELLATAGQADANALSLSPVPAQKELRVTLPGGTKLVSVHVTDVSGRVASVHQLGDGQLDVSNLLPGLYMLNASDGRREYHQKFVKE